MAAPENGRPGDVCQGALPAASVWGMSLLAGLLSLLAALLSLRVTSELVRQPFGRSDAVSMYQATHTMIRHGWFTWNPDIGYPYGMDAAHIPSPEIHQWLLLKVVTLMTSDPILALNVFFLLGFFAVGACSYLLFQPTVRLDWLALILSVSAATVPWHFSRFRHTLLADYSTVPIALLLGFLMWTGWWRHSGLRLALALAAATYVGTGGVYFAFYACLMIGPVLLWRVVSSRSPRLWWRDAVVTGMVPTALALSLAAHNSLARTPAASWAFARDPLESLAYSGDALSLFIPWPLREARFEGDARFSWLAVIAVFVSVGVLIWFATGFRGSRPGPTRDGFRDELTPWLRLFVWALLWFLPGLGWVFAVLVSPSLRSWGRVSVVVLFIAMVILGICIRGLMVRRPSARPWMAGALGLLLAGQVAQDHRDLLAPWASEFDSEVRRYAAALADAVPSDCPILQLPAIKFPESWPPPTPTMGPYDHMWLPVYASQFRWSFGVVAGSGPFSENRARYNEDMPIRELVAHAEREGYCAIHLDNAGLTEAQRAEVGEVLGQPIVTVARWALHTLPSEN